MIQNNKMILNIARSVFFSGWIAAALITALHFTSKPSPDVLSSAYGILTPYGVQEVIFIMEDGSTVLGTEITDQAEAENLGQQLRALPEDKRISIVLTVPLLRTTAPPSVGDGAE